MNEEKINVVISKLKITKKNEKIPPNPKDLLNIQIKRGLMRSRCIGHKTKRKQRTKSLMDLTLDFEEYSIKKGDIYIDLNDCQKYLKIPKRRIYDITNVLEGR